jgi:hypothetical protein
MIREEDLKCMSNSIKDCEREVRHVQFWILGERVRLGQGIFLDLLEVLSPLSLDCFVEVQLLLLVIVDGVAGMFARHMSSKLSPIFEEGAAEKANVFFPFSMR